MKKENESENTHSKEVGPSLKFFKFNFETSINISVIIQKVNSF